MKTCSYCGRENPDQSTYCSGCGQLFETHPIRSKNSFVNGGWVLLVCCPKVQHEANIVAILNAAGIPIFIPGIREFEESGADFESIPSIDEFAWIYVHLKDYPAAAKLLPEREPPGSIPFEPGEMRVIASLEASQTGKVLERLKLAGVPVEVRTASNEGGLEISEILVGEDHYEQGCDVVEALADEQAGSQRAKRVVCPNCGSKDCHRNLHIRLTWVNQCRDCGFEFP